MKHNFEERKLNRIAHAERMAEKKEAEGKAAYERAREIGSHIPLGQPILVGHHSERGHRADLKRIDNAMRKSVENSAKAKYYAGKAAAIEDNNAIFSDDPSALDKLREKLEGLTKLQELMKVTNQAIRKAKTPDAQIAALKELGFKEARIVQLLTPGFSGIGYPGYRITNNSANIRRIKQRIEQLEKVEAMETTEETIGNVRIVSNVEANRVQIFFPSIPAENVRKELKGSGFRWCRSEGAWQRHLNGWAYKLAKDIVSKSIENN